MSSSSIDNFFIINGYANLAVLLFESWVIWQKLYESELAEDPTKARDQYAKELKAAIDWAGGRNQIDLHTKLVDVQRKFSSLNFVSLFLFYQTYFEMMNQETVANFYCWSGSIPCSLFSWWYP